MKDAAQTTPIDDRLKIDWTSNRPWLSLFLLGVQLTVVYLVGYVATAFVAETLSPDSKWGMFFLGAAVFTPFWMAVTFPLANAFPNNPNPVDPEADLFIQLWCIKANRLPMYFWSMALILLNCLLVYLLYKHFSFESFVFVFPIGAIGQTPHLLSGYIAHVLRGETRPT